MAFVALQQKFGALHHFTFLARGGQNMLAFPRE
jgi:hypothetical protein